MLFNSFSFLIFFPTVTVLYFLTPHPYRWFLLLVASCIFYMAFIPVYILVLALTIAIDYTAALLIERSEGRRRKVYLVGSIVSTCMVLFIFKYFNFFNSNLADVARFFHWNYPIEALSLILPIGLSFHTFQSLSYVIEVYRRNFKAEHHFGIYALYVMFYPQLVAGPIERPGNLIHQLREKRLFDYQRVMDGLKLMAWGFFKKVVIADRLALLTDKVFSNPTQYSGLPVLAAAISFAIQVYCDFSGYSDIAIGSAQVMGIRLMENFNRPFFSASVPEFWRRWHMSLMTWFRDYVYIPMGGNRVSRGRWYLNIFITFTLSGLWHGANWGFIIWGALNGVYIIFSDVTRHVREKGLAWTRLDRLPSFHRGVGIAFTFFLFWFTLIFFRTRNLSDAFYVMTHLGIGLGGSGGFHESVENLYSVFPKYELLTVLVAIGWMVFIEAIERPEGMRHPFERQPVWARWSIYYVCILFLIFFGEYNDQSFIYFQF
jgi:D-alanyl-lipoteichoic acid acyltransferase DltB (MBOAT superfamily)